MDDQLIDTPVNDDEDDILEGLQVDHESKKAAKAIPSVNSLVDRARQLLAEPSKGVWKVIIPVGAAASGLAALAALGWAGFIGIQFLFSISPLLGWLVLLASAAQLGLTFLAFWAKQLGNFLNPDQA